MARTARGRLFVALDLPEDVRGRLARWQASALTDPAIRPVRPEALHITLAFLGWKAEADFGRVAQAALEVGPVAAPMLELSRQVVPLPRGRPRLLAIEARSAEAIALQEGVEARLVDAGLYQPEERPFWPHVTVGRVRPEKPGSRRPARLSGTPDPLPEGYEQAFGTVRLRVYRSFLRPTGAEYVPLFTRDLLEHDN